MRGGQGRGGAHLPESETALGARQRGMAGAAGASARGQCVSGAGDRRGGWTRGLQGPGWDRSWRGAWRKGQLPSGLFLPAVLCVLKTYLLFPR